MNASQENRTDSTSVQFNKNYLIILSSTVVGLTFIACLAAFIYRLGNIGGRVPYAENSICCLKHILWTLIRILFFLADLVSDIAMTYIYCIENNTRYFILSLIFTTFPGLVYIVSIIFIVIKENEMSDNKSDENNENYNHQKKENDSVEKNEDNDNKRGGKRVNYHLNKLIILGCLFFSPFIQLFLLTGILAIGPMHKRSVKLDILAYSLGLIETTFESAPQIILLININIESTYDEENKSKYFRYITLIGSVLGLAKSMYNFKHNFEMGVRSKMSVPTKIMSFLSRIAEIGPRILILALFVSEFKYYSVIFFAVHIAIMFVVAFAASCNNEVSDPIEKRRETMLLLVGSFANTFFFCRCRLFDNVNSEIRTKITILFFIFYCTENIVLIILWCIETNDKDVWYFKASIAVAAGGIPLHFILFQLYLHLKRRNRKYPSEIPVDDFDENEL